MAQLKDTVISGNLRVTDTVLADSVQADEIKKTGGTSSQFLKADGSVDSNTYALASAVPSAVTESTISEWGFTKNAAPGTLTTTSTAALDTATNEALSGSISLHKIAKTGSYSDLIGTPGGNAKIFYGTCSTSANVGSKDVTCPDFKGTDLVDGALIFVTFTNTNTADPSTLSLSVNRTLIRGIYTYYSQDGELHRLRSANALHSNGAYLFTYDGYLGAWVLLTYNTDTQANWNETSSSSPAYIQNKPALGETNMTSTTWSELKTLRDGGNLVPGMQYRITDYTCTTVQTDTQSAGHVFDIIVIADSETKLNEYARATLHSGDTYFSGNKLEKWELKYRLDNDTTEFAWADSTNGKGVIYWMKDDGENECYYDFKNIQFKPGVNAKAGTIANVFYYTFSVATGTNDSTVTDHSLNTTYCYLNKLGRYINSNKQTLSQNVFRNISSTNTCYSNIMSKDCCSNVFGSGCSANMFYDGCNNNSFGDTCNNNEFGSGCYYNSFSNYCTGNSSADSVQYCSLGANSSNNCFRGYNREVILGNYCTNNIFEILSSYCTLGSTCTHNIFGVHSWRIKFGTSDTVKSHYDYIIIDPGNQYLYLNFEENSNTPCRNIRIAQGVNNTTTWKTITNSNVGQTYQTIYQPANSKIISI